MLNKPSPENYLHYTKIYYPINYLCEINFIKLIKFKII